MERAEGQHSIDNGLDSGRGVGSGLHRGRVDIVVDYVDKNSRPWRPTPDTKDKKSTKPTTRTLQQPEREPITAMAITIIEWAKQEEHSHVGTLIIAQLANRDPTRQCAEGNSSKNAVYIFLLHYDCSINKRLICNIS